MFIQTAPMTRHTIQFAKDYRAEQIRHTRQGRRTAQFHAPRFRRGRFRQPLVTTISRLRSRRVTTEVKRHWSRTGSP